MPKPLIKFAPYFVHCKETKEFGFLVLSATEKIIVFSKSDACLHIEVALGHGVIQKDESLELLRQIETSKMKEKMNAEVCMLVLEKLNLEEVYGDCFSRPIYRPSLN